MLCSICRSVGAIMHAKRRVAPSVLTLTRRQWGLDVMIVALCLLSIVQKAKGEIDRGSHSRPPIYVFGDSLVDVGNNKFFPFSPARADFLPYGIDFVYGPTGRFCNGRHVLDILCDMVGISYIPAYFDPTTSASDAMKGMSFASGLAGILDATGNQYYAHLSMNKQVMYFNDTVQQMTLQFGLAYTSAFLERAIIAIAIGSNDFINNYWHPTSFDIRAQYTTHQFNIRVLDTFGHQLTTLYNLGVRKFFVMAVGPLGCLPATRIQTPTLFNACAGAMNKQVLEFNTWGLRDGLLPQLTRRLPGTLFVYANVFNLFESILADPQSYGFRQSIEGCCGVFPLCIPFAPICSNRSEYVFWDNYHPTEAINVIIASQLYNGGLNAASPLNFEQLFNLASS